MCALDEPTWPMGSSERSGLDGRWQSVRVYECASVKKTTSFFETKVADVCDAVSVVLCLWWMSVMLCLWCCL